MSKEVVLMEDVDGLGHTGEVVRVADGYARNYLFPRNLAALVTAVTRRQIEKRQKDAEAKREAARVECQQLAAKLEATPVTLKVRTGSEGKLFGSVTAHDILEFLKKAGIELEKGQVHLDHPIKELGEFTVPVRLKADVKAQVKLTVAAE